MSKKINENNIILKGFFSVIILISIIATVSIVTIYGISDELSQLTHNWGFFRTYTVLSNIMMGIVSAITLYFLITKKDKMPNWVYTLELVGTTVVMVTFVTVILFLGPMRIINGKSVWFLFSKELFFLHFLNPIFAFISTTLLSDNYNYSIKECFISTIPTIIYSVVYLYNVIIAKTWYDFYGFTFGGKYYLIPFILIIMYLVTFLLAMLIRKIHNKKVKSFK